MGHKEPVKILHYCWFGGNPLPPETVSYMESWKKYLPDFEIMRWDESNFDVHSVPFVEEAYTAKKWAFVSDYVRCYALYHYGGLYLDTDVEIIRDLYDLFDTSFVGFEEPEIVAPGLILYAKKNNELFYYDLLQYYQTLHFSVDNMDSFTSPIIFTKLLSEIGLKKDNSLQCIAGITVYPMEYFNPIGAEKTAKPIVTHNTRTIHWYSASWLQTLDAKLWHLRKRYGHKKGNFLFSILHPFAAWKRYKKRKKDK